MNAAQPLAPPSIVDLEGVDEVLLGRGRTLEIDVQEGRRVRLLLPDVAVSTNHARVVRSASGWDVVDEDSKNGTLVNGKRVTSAPFGTGDLLELGNSFCFLRYGAEAPADGPPAFRTLSRE